ncbi:hypothetical protein DRE_04304 [Drechslerella stenobrocha 248]|uniref:Uncharacterized protein n=1 Tax=Drechslerella stenobrocha 248 TaxID=1043628 RepID=W7HQC8_9PEZI|nr:hypothetical protein DRE_04304 [Drechslerella stenobrocha 248]
MPFDFKRYDEKCLAMSPEELQLQWEHYTRLISGAATSTAVSGVALPLTMGVSVVGVAMAAPAIHNARKKREIIEKHLNRHGTTHVTRKRDVLSSVAISGTVGVVTMGASSIATDALSSHAAEYGVRQVVENEVAVKVGTHIAFDAAAMAGEHAHTEHKRKNELMRAHQQGRIATGSVSGADVKQLQLQAQAQPTPPDGFYPIVPLPQRHGDPNSLPIMASAYPQPVLPSGYPPPPPAGFVSDPKLGIVVGTGSPNLEHHQTAPACAPTSPPAAFSMVHIKAETSPQEPPVQHYRADPANIQTYPSHPGTILGSPLVPQVSLVAPHQALAISPPAKVAESLGTPPGLPPSQSAQSAVQPFGSVPPPPPQGLGTHLLAAVQQVPSYQPHIPPPPSQPYTLHHGTTSFQKDTFQQNALLYNPPPPPPHYDVVTTRTSASFRQPYIPAAHCSPAGHAAGYPIATYYTGNQIPQAPQQLIDGKQAFTVYPKVPVPAPQILSQQGQYIEKQAMMSQYHSIGFVPQPSPYGY